MKSQNCHKSDTAKLRTRLFNGRILVVDDESSLLRSLVFTLKRNGFFAVGCGSSESAMQEILRADKKESFDLMITDIQLPGISGLELIEAINRKNIFLPSLVITNYRTNETASRLSKLDCRGYLDKPFTTTELLHQVAETIQNCKKSPERKNTFQTGLSLSKKQLSTRS